MGAALPLLASALTLATALGVSRFALMRTARARQQELEGILQRVVARAKGSVVQS